MGKKVLVFVLMLSLAGAVCFGQEEKTDQQKPAEPAIEEAFVGIGLFVGYWGSWIEGFKDAYGTAGGLSWGAQLGFNIKGNLYGLVDYTYFYQPHEMSELDFTQNVFTAGIRYSYFGAGINYTSIKVKSSSSSSGIGFYTELVIPMGKHFFGGVKANFVNINQARAGGMSYYAGYSF